MSDFKSKKIPVDVVDMNQNRVLSGLSLSLKDSHVPDLRSSQETPTQNMATSKFNINNNKIQYKDVPIEILEKPIVYPVPLATYNPNRTPPDLMKAAKHGYAHEVKVFKAASWSGEHCESTGIPLIYKDTGLFCPNRDLHFLGPVIPLYFLLLKQLAVIALILTLIPIGIVVAFNEDYSWNYRAGMALLFNDSHQTVILVLCSIGAVIVLFFVMYIFRTGQKNTKAACKKGVITPSDYTIMASNMGVHYTEEEIRTFFSSYIIHGYNLDVCKSTITYDIQRYVNKVRDLKILMDAKKDAEDSDEVSDRTLRKIDERIGEIKCYLLGNYSFLIGGKGLNKNGLSFITFNTKQEAKSIRRKFELSWLETVMIWLLEKCTDEFPEYFFKQNFMTVKKAPDFNEILWHNLNCYTSAKGTALLNIISLLAIIVIDFVALKFLKECSFKGIEYVAGFVVAVFNELIGFTISFLAYHEKFRTISEWKIAIEQRTALAQLVNSAVPIIILDLIITPVSNVADFSFDIIAISVVISFLPVLLRLVNIPYIQKRIQRRRITQQIKSNSSSYGITQEEANHAYEGVDFDVPNLYADTIKTFLFSCFFFTVSPGVMLIAFVSYILAYFIDKYNLLRKSVLPSDLKAEVSEAIFEFLDFAIFLLALGTNLLIHLNINTGLDQTLCQSISAAILIASLIYLLLPHKRFARGCFSKKKAVFWTNILFYQQATEYFHSEYPTSNPISKHIKNPKDSKEIVKTIFAGPKISADLSEIPEVLNVFEYAHKKPNLSEIFWKELKGLRNPYYVFPQNYAYGVLSAPLETMPDDKDAPSSIKAPLMSNLPTPRSYRDTITFRRPVIRSQEMVPSSTSSQGDKDKIVIVENGGADSRKANSVMKDIMLLGKSDYTIKGHQSSRNKDDFDHGFNEADEKSMTQDSPAGGTTRLGLIDGISPIVGGWVSNEDKKKNNNLTKRV